jgi:hypothetical protein
LQWYANEKHGAARAALEFDQAAMTAQQFLCGWQSKPGAIRTTCDQRVEHRVLKIVRDARPVILDFD